MRLRTTCVLAVGLLCVASLLGGMRPTLASPASSSAIPDAVDICLAATGIDQVECRILMDLYEQTDGWTWTQRDGWGISTTPCTWYGVTCKDMRVVRLELPENNLMGTLFLDPYLPSWGYLSHLEVLDLAGNRLTSNLPRDFGSQLRILRLDHNHFTGPIPREFGQLVNLEQLWLQENELTGSVPPELGNLWHLERLYLQQNQLGGILPPELMLLGNLERFSASDNQLCGPIPDELQYVTTLTGLNLSNNHLSGEIPSWLGRLADLQTLNLSRNRLGGAIPAALGDLTALQELSLGYNQLSGQAPAALANLSSITTLDVDNNALRASDPTAQAFLDAHQPGWEQTQTVPPTGLRITEVTATTIKLSWTPIAFTAPWAPGCYQVGLTTVEGRPWTPQGVTRDKLASSFQITGLEPFDPVLDPYVQRYHVAVRTYTWPHGDQQNGLWSEWSDSVSTLTLPREWRADLPLIWRAWRED
jgi:hypothetical protein